MNSCSLPYLAYSASSSGKRDLYLVNNLSKLSLRSGDSALSMSPLLLRRKMSTYCISTEILQIATVSRFRIVPPKSIQALCVDSPRTVYHQSRWSFSREVKARKSRAIFGSKFLEAGRSQNIFSRCRFRLNAEQDTFCVFSFDGISEEFIDSSNFTALLGRRDVYSYLRSGFSYLLLHDRFN